MERLTRASKRLLAVSPVTMVALLPHVALAQSDGGMGFSSQAAFTLFLVDENDQVLPNRQITEIVRRWNTPDGGHAPGHSACPVPNSCLGGHTPAQCNTGPNGAGCVIVLTSREVGTSIRFEMRFVENGQERSLLTRNKINITSRGGPNIQSSMVGRPGQGSTFVLIGSTTTHPNNHYCRSAFCEDLTQLASEYNARWSRRLAYNDSSLIKGGLFDISANWQPPHNLHRTGRDQDVRANGAADSIPFNSEIRQWFVTRITAIFGRAPLLESSGTSNEHYHIFGE
ncbi:MAG: hypothetical protein GEU99_09010 [Luteitalea sp.]|nr:hypothetical protein [Luteitalea sp.]